MKGDQLILDFTWRVNKRRGNRILKIGGLILSDLKIYYRATVTRTLWSNSNQDSIKLL